MKNTYRKTVVIMAVLTMFVVLSMPCSAWPIETLDVNWDGANITVNVTGCKPDHWYQTQYYQPGTNHPDTPYFISIAWRSDATGTHNETFASDILGIWTVWLFKAGASEDLPINGVRCKRVSNTADVLIPEFTTTAIPTVAILGLFAFYRRKQKK